MKPGATGAVNVMGKSTDHIYVAELRTPTCFFSNSEVRRTIEAPARFEIDKGYYVVRGATEQHAESEYGELILVTQFASKGLIEAENHALKVGRAFASLASSYGGYPLDPPFLKGSLAPVPMESY